MRNLKIISIFAVINRIFTMKGKHDKIYIASNDMDYSHPDECEFDILLTEPPLSIMYKTYVRQQLVLDMLEKLKTVCGNTAMRYVQKQIDLIK